MKIIFVRHGKDDDKYRGGWSAIDLTSEGIEQANQLANHLKENFSEYRIQQIITSDLPRALSTARFISSKLDLPIRQELRLREMNNGDLAGMLNEEAEKQYPNLFFRSLKMNEPYPNGESPIDFFVRIKSWFDEFAEKNKNLNDNILVVTHGGVINIIYHLINGVEWSNRSRVYKAANCSIHILDMDAMKFIVENKIDFLQSVVHK